MCKKFLCFLCITANLAGSLQEMKDLAIKLGKYGFLKEVGKQTVAWYKDHKNEIKFEPNASTVYNFELEKIKKLVTIPQNAVQRVRIPVIEVVNKDSFAAARDILKENKDFIEQVAVLNFANEDNAGGGFVGGAAAQEESLCRQSTLYEALITERNKVAAGPYVPKQGAIYTPNVYVFRNGRDKWYSFIEDVAQRFYVNVITSAAPSNPPAMQVGSEAFNKEEQKKYIRDNTDYIRIILAKIRAQIIIAIEQGNRVFVAGAWGCGAFNNLPEIISRAYYYLLVEEKLGTYFDKVVFAILHDEEKPDHNFNAFQARFEGFSEAENALKELANACAALSKKTKELQG